LRGSHFFDLETETIPPTLISFIIRCGVEHLGCYLIFSFIYSCCIDFIGSVALPPIFNNRTSPFYHKYKLFSSTKDKFQQGKQVAKR
jgi:hypothetical protein